MSVHSDIPLSYAQYSKQNEVDDMNNLYEGDKEMKQDSNFKVIPPIQPLGDLFRGINFNSNKQNSIDILNTSTDIISTTKFNPENKDKKEVVFETDENNNFIVMLQEDKHKEIIVKKKENQDYEVMKFTKDKPSYSNGFISSFYITSLTVVGLFIIYRMIQKSG